MRPDEEELQLLEAARAALAKMSGRDIGYRNAVRLYNIVRAGKQKLGAARQRRLGDERAREIGRAMRAAETKPKE